jgi:hypothetical protein
VPILALPLWLMPQTVNHHGPFNTLMSLRQLLELHFAESFVARSALICCNCAAFAFVAFNAAFTFKAVVIMLTAHCFDCINACDELIELREI